MEPKYVLFLLISVAMSSFSQILLKKSAGSKHRFLLSEYLNIYVISGYALMLAATVMMLIAYSGMDYKNGPVIQSVGYMIVMLLSFVFFGEKITKRKLIGNLLILLGIFVYFM